MRGDFFVGKIWEGGEYITPGLDEKRLVHNPGVVYGNISDFMWNLQNAYSKYFNIKYKRKLTLFEWRFKAKLIDNDDYLNQCLAYVNFNPLKHEIVDNIDNYKWTSYHQMNKEKLKKYKDMSLDELEM